MRPVRTHRWLAASAALVLIAAGTVALLQRPGAAPEPTPAATVKPSPTPVPGPTLGASFTVNLVAVNIEFRPKLLEVPAFASFVVHFRNADPADVIHAVDVRDLNGINVVAEQGPIVGGTQADFRFGPLPAGDYMFICAIHPIPAMTGTLRVR